MYVIILNIANLSSIKIVTFNEKTIIQIFVQNIFIKPLKNKYPFKN